MIQLTSQRRQRTAPRPPHHDLPHQMTRQPLRQPLRQHFNRNAQHLCRGRPRARQARITHRSKHSRDPRLQPLQHRPPTGQQPVRHRITEDLADHHRQLPAPAAPGPVQLPGSELNSDPGRLPQRPFLLTAEY